MSSVSRFIPVTQGNINSNHLYLRRVLDLFPPDVFGGSNVSREALRTVRVLWGSEAVESDIDQSKGIFRKRYWLARFFKENDIRAGDRVLLERLGPYLYRVSKAGAASTSEMTPDTEQGNDPGGSAGLMLASPGDGGNRPGQGVPCGNDSELSLRDLIASRDRFTCQSCGRRTRGQMHHILPRGLGGPDTPANLVTLCGRCHMLVSPIPVEVLCRVLGLQVGDLLVERAKVEVRVHSWVLRQADHPADWRVQPPDNPGVSADSVTPVSPVTPAALACPDRRPRRAGTAWTKAEDAALLSDFDAALPIVEIARRRQRGVIAVRLRLMKLGRQPPVSE